MVQLPKPFPRFFKLVDKPATAPATELAKAQLIYIDGLDTSGGGPTTVDWNAVENKPSTYAPVIGTTATTAKAGNYQPTAANISDASDVGRNVLKAADAAAARTAIGAGTGSGTSNVKVSTAVPKAPGTAAAGTSADAARADHVHPLPQAMTAAEAAAGTSEQPMLISPKVLLDEIKKAVATL